MKIRNIKKAFIFILTKMIKEKWKLNESKLLIVHRSSELDALIVKGRIGAEVSFSILVLVLITKLFKVLHSACFCFSQYFIVFIYCSNFFYSSLLFYFPHCWLANFIISTALCWKKPLTELLLFFFFTFLMVPSDSWLLMTFLFIIKGSFFYCLRIPAKEFLLFDDCFFNFSWKSHL